MCPSQVFVDAMQNAGSSGEQSPQGIPSFFALDMRFVERFRPLIWLMGVDGQEGLSRGRFTRMDGDGVGSHLVEIDHGTDRVVIDGRKHASAAIEDGQG